MFVQVQLRPRAHRGVVRREAGGGREDRGNRKGGPDRRDEDRQEEIQQGEDGRRTLGDR